MDVLNLVPPTADEEDAADGFCAFYATLCSLREENIEKGPVLFGDLNVACPRRNEAQAKATVVNSLAAKFR